VVVGAASVLAICMRVMWCACVYVFENWGCIVDYDVVDAA
jgi:hypothetical protein